jgi:hypothetical protein
MRLRGDSRANGCAVTPNQAPLLERSVLARRVHLGGIRHDSRRSGLPFGVFANPGSASADLAQSDAPRRLFAFGPLSGGRNRPDGSDSATEDVRGWAMRSRLFQLTGEEGQRPNRRPVAVALHQSQLRRNCQAAGFRLVQHVLFGRSKDPTFEKVVL